MALKDRMQLLTTPETVDHSWPAPGFRAIFKAGACHKTDAAFRHVQAPSSTPGRTSRWA